MARDIASELENLPLRVLEEYDEEHHTYVARCLDTGAVAVGETPEEAHSIIKQVIASDILLAIQAGHLRGLFRVCAAPDVIDRWYAVKSDGGEVETEKLDIALPPPKRGVQSELSIVKATHRRTA
jgi:hypothetical protein